MNHRNVPEIDLIDQPIVVRTRAIDVIQEIDRQGIGHQETAHQEIDQDLRVVIITGKRFYTWHLSYQKTLKH